MGVRAEVTSCRACRTASRALTSLWGCEEQRWLDDIHHAVFTLPILSQPSFPPTISYNLHRIAPTPLVVDNGSTSLRFAFATSTTPQVAPNITSKYRERKAGKQLLLFTDAVDAEGGTRWQAKTREGDVLLNFDALASPTDIAIEP